MAQQIDFDPSVDYYKALGVGEKASADEIKKAYRKLAKQYHPDSTGGDKAKESRFKEVQNAYDVLGDQKKRGLYDQVRAHGVPISSGGRGGSTQYTYTSQGPAPNIFDLGDLFSQMFRNGRSRMRMDEEEEPRDGARQRRRDVQDAEFESKVKASDGTWLKVEGIDVHSDVRISFDRAILGTVATVATVDGKAEVKVPPGTASGKKLRLRGKGVSDRSGRSGDHLITVHIDVPGDLDDDGKKLLIQLVQRIRKRPQGD
jgi:molecular chaperone DnaJ